MPEVKQNACDKRRCQSKRRKRPVVMTTKEEQERQAAYQEFWSDPCWQEPLK